MARVLPQEQMWKKRTGSKYIDILKTMGANFVVGQFFNFISTSSKKNLILLTKLFEKIAHSEGGVRHARRMRWLFETDHAHLHWWQKVINDLDPNCRNKFLANFFLHGYYGDNLRKRAMFHDKNGFYPPTVLLASITEKCNFKCVGCWASEYDHSKVRDLPIEEWDRILGEAREEMGVHIVPVVGGEPFCRMEFFELAKKYDDCIFLVFTNGSLLNDKNIAKIKELGNVAPMLSLSGWEKSTDAIRGEGTFKMISEKMDMLKKAGIFWGVSLTATRENAEEVVSDDFMTWLSDKGSLWTWVFHYVPVGNNPNPSLIPDAPQREFIKQNVYNARNTLPMMTVDFWGDGPEMMGCIAGGRQYIHINAAGDIEPCTFVHLATHNIKDCTLTEALQSPFFTAIRKGAPYDGNMMRPCMIVDRPWVLRGYYKKFKPYATHPGADDYLVKPELTEAIDKYSEDVARIMDENWTKDYFMTLFPLPGEWYHDRKVLCSSKEPHGKKHGGCGELENGCTCGKDLSSLEKLSADPVDEEQNTEDKELTTV
jgi:MoaA/NifB/PqqE/SkfB family radical SAM enzyme